MAARKRGPKDQLRESTITIRQNLEGLYDGKHRPEAFAGLGAIRQPPGAILITALPTQSRLLVDGYGAFRDPRFQPIVDDCVLKLCAQLALIEQPTGVEIRRQRVLKGKRPDPPCKLYRSVGRAAWVDVVKARLDQLYPEGFKSQLCNGGQGGTEREFWGWTLAYDGDDEGTCGCGGACHDARRQLSYPPGLPLVDFMALPGTNEQYIALGEWAGTVPILGPDFKAKADGLKADWEEAKRKYKQAKESNRQAARTNHIEEEEEEDDGSDDDRNVVAATQQRQQRLPLDNNAFLWAFNTHHGSNVHRSDGIERISKELRCRKGDVTKAVNAVLQENGGLRWGQPTEEQAAYISSVFDQHMSDGYPKEIALELTMADLASNWKPTTVVDTLRRLKKIGNSNPGRPPATARGLGEAGRTSWSSYESEEYRDGVWGGSTDGGDSRRSSISGGEVRSSSSDEVRSRGGGDEVRSRGGGDEVRSRGGGDEVRSRGGGDEVRSRGGGDEVRSRGGGGGADDTGLAPVELQTAAAPDPSVGTAPNSKRPERRGKGGHLKALLDAERGR
ncbi:hypothetical protein PLESTB_001204900 [Pleodorina starrii]|uniref:Uncharacterized protein n=1 Tax=Pleodorina starrii TaxID=330485 RepID=A0A9W6BRY0_9CHLO|nr:hypothetical protein PLESTB_001204900 [Pleodorina starrii]